MTRREGVWMFWLDGEMTSCAGPGMRLPVEIGRLSRWSRETGVGGSCWLALFRDEMRGDARGGGAAGAGVSGGK